MRVRAVKDVAFRVSTKFESKRRLDISLQLSNQALKNLDSSQSMIMVAWTPVNVLSFKIMCRI